MLAKCLKIYEQSQAVFFQLNLQEIMGKKGNSGALLLSALFGTR